MDDLKISPFFFLKSNSLTQMLTNGLYNNVDEARKTRRSERQSVKSENSIFQIFTIQKDGGMKKNFGMIHTHNNKKITVVQRQSELLSGT